MKRRTYLATMLAVSARFAVPGSVLALSGCSASGMREAVTRFSGPTMGTAYRVTVAQRLSADETQALRTGVASVLERVDALMSTYRPGSELSRFNAAAAGERVAITPETSTVMAEALRAAMLSGGAFDVTVGPLVDLWGFGPPRREGMPSDEAIADASALTGLRELALDAGSGVIVKGRAGLRVDLSGIAKGYAVDLVAAHLDATGHDRYLIDVGGELAARGRKADGSPWRVGIERPLPGHRAVQRVIALEGSTIATSGDYRNFFVHDGRRYPHTIDPRTGRPVRHPLASVSVLADRAMAADALSTAMMVLGPDEGLALAERLDVPALFLLHDKDGGVVERATPGFTSRVRG